MAKYCDENVCVSVCPWAYLQNHTYNLYQMASPPPARLKNPKQKGQLSSSIIIKGRTIQPKLDRTDPVKSAASESAIQYRSDTDSDLP